MELLAKYSLLFLGNLQQKKLHNSQKYLLKIFCQNAGIPLPKIHSLSTLYKQSKYRLRIKQSTRFFWYRRLPPPCETLMCQHSQLDLVVSGSINAFLPINQDKIIVSCQKKDTATRFNYLVFANFAAVFLLSNNTTTIAVCSFNFFYSDSQSLSPNDKKERKLQLVLNFDSMLTRIHLAYI